jgi:TPR repeat protein
LSMLTRFVLTLLIGLVVSLGLPNSSFAQYSTDYWEKYSDDVVCSASVRFSKKLNKKVWGDHSGNNQNASRLEAWRRGLSCGVSEPDYQLINKELNTYALERSDYGICFLATKDGGWEVREDWVKYVETAKRRGLSCGVDDASDTQIVSPSQTTIYSDFGLTLDITKQDEIALKNLLENNELCERATITQNGILRWNWTGNLDNLTEDAITAQQLGLSCGLLVNPTTQTASALVPKAEPRATSAALTNTGFGEAMTAFENKDYATALKILQPLADRGIPRAQYNLGVMHDNGFGVLKNHEKAMRWYKFAAEQGYSPAQFNLAVMYEKGEGSPKDYIEAARLYKLAAAQGDNLAQYNLGVLYDNGLGVRQDFSEAVRLYKLAAEEGLVQARTRLAQLGIGTSEASESFKLRAESEERKRKELERQLAALKAQQEQRQQTINSDTKLPTITIASASSNGPQGTISGRVTDNTGVAELRVDGKQIQTDKDGNFTANTYVPEGGVSVSIQAVDLAGLSSSMFVRLDRSATNTVASISFERLNPLGRKVAKNKDALALIIGVDGYKSTPARAIYADSDAKVFTDYASQKLGIPSNRIKTLVNDGAGEREMLLSVKSWLARASKQGKTDVYIFFAGHGLASDDGQKMYLLPYDGAPELLDDTAILRDRLFSDIASANPRSVTVFLDTCYSGTTRGTDMLIASRPIAIKALKQLVPDNFTVMTAARGDQTAKPLEEAKHGMFSYFLMKGMEGDADANQDNQITAGELHQYVEQNVVQQSSGSQTPELQGDANRVLVRFQ